jgi:hypothetical protein
VRVHGVVGGGMKTEQRKSKETGNEGRNKEFVQSKKRITGKGKANEERVETKAKGLTKHENKINNIARTGRNK